MNHLTIYGQVRASSAPTGSEDCIYNFRIWK